MTRPAPLPRVRSRPQRSLTILTTLALVASVVAVVGFDVQVADAATTLVVNSTGDGGDSNLGNGSCETSTPAECTLRAAIEEANALAGTDLIEFNIPISDPNYTASPLAFKIEPSSLLPAISTLMSIDGSTQPEHATEGRPVIEIDGTSVSAGEENGLYLTAGGTTLRGLVLNNWGDDAIDIEFNGGNTIVGNYIGTNVTGTAAEPNAWGINLKTGGNTIGGSDPADRNVVSGNTLDGLYIYTAAATGNLVEGNHVGTNAAGTAAVANGRYGFNIHSGANGNTIGGPTAAYGNVISGNGTGESGIVVDGGATSGNTIRFNRIGTNADGDAAIPNNLHGLIIDDAPGTLILDNLISGNDVHGVYIYDTGATGTLILRNTIGTNLTATAPLPNGFDGVRIEGWANGAVIGSPGNGNVIAGNTQRGINLNNSNDNTIQANSLGTDTGGAVDLGNTLTGIYTDAWGSSDNLIGGTVLGEGNTIAFNGEGITFLSGADNAIIGNDIYTNDAMGIDFDDDGVTPNSNVDAWLNYPEITAATVLGGSVTVDFDLDVPDGAYRVEFFTNPNGVDTTHGEGESFVSSVDVTVSGGSPSPSTDTFGGSVGDQITATATSGTSIPFGSTSEFSAWEAVTLGGFVVNSTTDRSDAATGDGDCDTGFLNSQGIAECTLRAAIEQANFTGGADDIVFDIPATELGHTAGIWTISPGSSFDPLSGTVEVNATTQTGWTSTPVVELNGGGSGGGDGFNVDSDNSEIRGLAINRFGDAAIEVESGATGTVIASNHVGLDATGLIDRGNGRGVYLSGGSASTTVGGTSVIDRNVISGNDTQGVVLWNSDLNTIIGNFVGTDVTGNAPIPNDDDGIGIGGSSANNKIGQLGDGNVISGNGEDAIEIGGIPSRTTVKANTIGLGLDGITPVANGRHGVVLYNGTNLNQIGGGPGEGNTISANTDNGLVIDGNGDPTTINNIVEGNFIGTDASGILDRGNGANGIRLFDQATATVIGSPGKGNVVSGNGEDGIYIQDVGTDNTVIQGNHFGTNANGDAAIPNDDRGIQIESGASFTQVGGTGVGEGNVVSGNGSDGIIVADWLTLGTTGTVIEGNLIGVEADGTSPLGNGQHGVFIDPVTGNRVGGDSAPAGNTIANNVGSGIHVAPTSGTNTFLGNDVYLNGGLGIDLAWDGVTPNSNVDAWLNYPEITSATASGIIVTLGGTYDVPAGNYRFEFFKNPAGADPTGFGEGEQHVASSPLSHSGTGPEGWGAAFVGAVGDIVTVTLTEDLGGGNYGATSEFSAAVTVAPPCADSDGDGLCDLEEDANTDLDNDPATNPGPNTDGDLLPNYLDADDDEDGTSTASENADPNTDGDPRDALDSDRDGQPDYLDEPTGTSNGSVNAEQKISETEGGLLATLTTTDHFGRAVAAIGDIDSDGINDIAVGAPFDDDGSSDRGAVYVLFLNADGTVKNEQKISDTAGSFSAVLNNSDEFGMGVTGLGDLDGDGVNDIAVGAHQDDDGGGNLGAVYVLFLNADGTVKNEQKISHLVGGLATALSTNDRFGSSLANIGDLNGDGLNDLIVGAKDDDDTNIDSGAAYVLFLNADGTVKNEQKISNLAGGLGASLGTSDGFGVSVAGPGDIDGDGIEDIVVGAWLDDDGSTNRGAAYVLFLNTNGTVKNEQKISDTAGGLAAVLDNNDSFGTAVGGVGDIDADGVPDLLVGAPMDGDGASLAGAAYVLFLNANGTVKAEQKISNLEGNLAATLGGSDQFGYAVTGIGDLDGDGTIGIAVGVYGDDDGGPADRGAVYVLDLRTALVVNSTGDAVDLAPGDGSCDTGATNLAAKPECTLRAAIQEANGLAGRDTIEFDIPISDPGYSASPLSYTIQPGSFLGFITGELTLDATTQPDHVADPIIELDGQFATGATAGLSLRTDDSEIRGFIVHSFDDDGLEIDGQTGFGDGNVIAGNWVGVDAAGDPKPNLDAGIVLALGANGNTIGGIDPLDANVIGSNATAGIQVREATSQNNTIVGNVVGALPDDTPRPNGTYGIQVHVGAANNRIGGTNSLEANLIANNGMDGVFIASDAGTGNSILRNEIRDNGDLGIDLAGGTEDGFGVTDNDSGDADGPGPNDLLNYPEVTAAAESGGTVTVDFDLDVLAGEYRIDLYTNASGVDPSGHGEGEQWEATATVTHTGSGAESFQIVYSGAIADAVTLTATEESTGPVYGSSSEFSARYTVNPPATVVVNSTGDTGDATPGDGSCDTGGLNTQAAPECTLRAAIEEANAPSGAVATIHFAIPTGDTGYSAAPVGFTIEPAGVLPIISQPLTIDATTQPEHATEGRPVIELSGASAGAVSGLTLTSTGSTIRGLAINRFGAHGIAINGGGSNTIVGNYIGPDVTGTVGGVGNNEAGIRVADSPGNIIGGSDPGDENVLSGNRQNGVFIDDWSDGVPVTSAGTQLLGNLIGVDATGLVRLPYSTGPDVSQQIGIAAWNTSSTEIGGTAADEGNVISGNSWYGVYLWGPDSSGNKIEGNVIGLDAAESAAIGNGDDNPATRAAVLLSSPGTVVGGPTPSHRNTIAGNDATGVAVSGTTSVDNAIIGNHIHGNFGLGIDLLNDGVTANDPGDGAGIPGPNELLNFPVITGSTESGGTVTVDFDLDTFAADYRIELFTNPAGAHGSGHGEGEVFETAMTVAHTGSGSESFQMAYSGATGDEVTLTATRVATGPTYESTSEFSSSATVTAANTAPTADIGGPYSIAEGEQLDLDASGSSDPEDSLTYAWDLDNDTFFDDETGDSPSVAWGTLAALGLDDDGTYPIAVQVDDGVNTPVTDTANVTIANAAPVLATTGVPTITAGALYTLTLGVTDPGADTITGWTVNWGDGTVDTLPGNPSSVTHRYADEGFTNDITASATDEDGTWHQNRLLVTNSTADELDRFERAVGTFVDVIGDGVDGLSAPAATVIGPDGAVYVASSTSGEVHRFDPIAGGHLSTFAASGIVTPQGLAFGPSGDLFVSDSSNDTVQRFQAVTGTHLGTFVSAGAGGLSTPRGLTFGPSDDLFVASAGTDSILRFDGDTGTFVETFAVGGGLDEPHDLAFGPGLHLYVSSFATAEILRFDGATGAPTGPFVVAGAGGLLEPAGLVFGPEGNLHVVDVAGNAVRRYLRIDGTSLGDQVAPGAGGLAGPADLVFVPELQVRTLPATAPNAPVELDPSVRRSDSEPAGGLSTAGTAAIAGDGRTWSGGAEQLVGPALDITTNELSLSAWVQRAASSIDQRIVAKSVDGTSTIYEMYIDGTTDEAVARMTTGGTTREARGGTVAVGTWHHVVAVWNGSTLDLFVDLSLVDSTAAAGTLSVDPAIPLTVGNVATADRGLVGILDEVRVEHRALSSGEVTTIYRTQTDPAATLSVGTEQSGVAAPWTVSGTETRSGSFALEAPTVALGSSAWATAIGIDEPGVVVDTWWWLSTDTGIDVATGVRTGAAPTDQWETSLDSPAGWDLGRMAGPIRPQDASRTGVPVIGAWVKVTMKTDQNGDSSVWIDDTEIISPTNQGLVPESGSIGLRAGLLPGGTSWFVDDVQARRLVTPEPVTSLGPLDRE